MAYFVEYTPYIKIFKAKGVNINEICFIVCGSGNLFKNNCFSEIFDDLQVNRSQYKPKFSEGPTIPNLIDITSHYVFIV
jgi:hypothetical protein